MTDEIYLTYCGSEQCLPGYRFDAEGRTGYHLHVISAGKGILWVNGKEKELATGQMFMTKPGEQAWYRADEKEPWEYCWMTFEGKLAEKYAESAGFGDGINWLDCNVDYRRFPSIVKQVLDRPEMTFANDLFRLSGLLKYLALAVENSQLGSQREKHSRTDYTDTYVDYAMNYITENYATAKVSDVARYIGIHRSYLTGIFRQKLGISPQEYLMHVKMEKARGLLLNSQAPVQEVSQMIGYENPLTFSKIFKSYFGMSPRSFRLSRITAEGEENEETRKK